MDMQNIIESVNGFDGVLVVQPQPGSDFPEIAWGDAFFYYAPDGVVPTRVQPYGTIVTKNYPDDTASDLDALGRFRVNVHAGRELVGELDADANPAAVDALVPHPLYASLGWLSVVNPGERTSERILELLRHAHDAEQARVTRRSSLEDQG